MVDSDMVVPGLAFRANSQSHTYTDMSDSFSRLSFLSTD
jgi:hypothetical protein